ncbi:MAG TPA: polyamine aminopropyltransferase [Acidobacteriota bacterium]|nr:polyamine aminopropyltransferase [Acidobacteriota bacterium]
MAENKNSEGKRVAVQEMDDLWNVWYSELHDGCCGLTLKVDRILESSESPFQRIDVIENRFFGKLLVLYGSLMVAENDWNAYNEMIVHVPLFTHPDPRQVLIVGGGDCGALTEVMKHPEVERCTMCELDEQVVETSRKHFPRLTAGLEDPRAELVFRDGKEFIYRGTDRYDVIVLDLSDPVGPAAELFQKPFHQAAFDRLNDGGILVAQAESPYFDRGTIAAMHANLADIFPVVRLYTCFMPIYPSGYWAFMFCSKGPDPLADLDGERWDRLKLTTRYYNLETHRAAFALPQFVQEMIAQK